MVLYDGDAIAAFGEGLLRCPLPVCGEDYGDQPTFRDATHPIKVEPNQQCSQAHAAGAHGIMNKQGI